MAHKRTPAACRWAANTSTEAMVRLISRKLRARVGAWRITTDVLL